MLLLLLLAAPGGAALAEMIPFRGGDVLAAELSSKRPAVANEAKFPLRLPFQKPIYAVVTVVMAPGRTLSVYDYAVEAFGVDYPCLAIRRNAGGFNAEDREFLSIDANDRFGLLFVLDASSVGLSKVEKLKFKARYAKGGFAATTVPFVLLENADFTATRSVASEGQVKLDE